MSTGLRKVRLLAAELAAALTLLFSLLYTVGFYEATLAAYSGRGSGLLAITSSVVAFALSARIRSPAVAGMLVSGGVIMLTAPIPAIMEAGMIAYPGPILGVISFGIIIIFGLVKAIDLRGREGSGASAPQSAPAEPGIARAVRILAGVLPDLFACSPTSASAVAISLFALSRLLGAGNPPSSDPELTSASRMNVGAA